MRHKDSKKKFYYEMKVSIKLAQQYEHVHFKYSMPPNASCSRRLLCNTAHVAEDWYNMAWVVVSLFHNPNLGRRE